MDPNLPTSKNFPLLINKCYTEQKQNKIDKLY